MELPIDRVFTELEVKFLINNIKQLGKDRLLFQIEQAYWYYEDFIAEESKLPVFIYIFNESGGLILYFNYK